MRAATESPNAKRWVPLPGLFEWTDVIGLVDRTVPAAKRDVRASLAQIDRSGLAFYRVFVLTDATCPVI